MTATAAVLLVLAHATGPVDGGTQLADATRPPPMAFAGGVTLDTPSAVLLDIRAIDAGTPAPFDGCIADTKSCIAMAQRVRYAEEQWRRAEAEKGWSPFAVALIGTLCVAAGFGLATMLRPAERPAERQP